MAPTVTRTQLTAAVEGALRSATSTHKRHAPDSPTADEALALWDVAHTTTRVALATYWIDDCGCPMVQAGLADKEGTRRPGLSLDGSMIDVEIPAAIWRDAYVVVDG